MERQDCNSFQDLIMDKKNHYKKQVSYFDKEFATVSNYRLAAWQKSYIEKIKTYLIKDNFKNRVLLDIGTGTGYVAIEMAKMGLQVTACDLSPKAIENLERYKKQYKLKNLTLMVCNAEEIPLKQNSVDYIVCNALLEHLPNEKKSIQNWKKLLNKNGKMLITVPLSLKHVWPFLWPINIIHDKRLGHLRRYDKVSIKNKFNLKIEQTFYTGHILKVVGVILSMILRTHKFDTLLEKVDKIWQDRAYGANNISIIFKNEK